MTVALPAQVQFYGVGQLPGGFFRSEIRDAILTPDGIVAVGTASRFGLSDTPIKWTPSGGLVLLASDFPTNTSGGFIAARVISANGAVFGGSSRDAAVGSNPTPTLWTNGGTSLTRLGYLPGATRFTNVGVNSLSADGSVAYGFTGGVGFTLSAFRYTAAGGLVGLGYLHAGDNRSITSPHSASADGTVVIGNSGLSPEVPHPGTAAFRYVYTGVGPTGGVMTALPALPGGTWTFAFAMTPDGTKMIGISDAPGVTGGLLVRWGSDGSIESLGAPAGNTSFSNFGGVSADGETIAIATSAGTFLRNPSGWSNLATLVAAAGVDLTGWSITTVLGMSFDARLIYGAGNHNGVFEGYIIQLPPNLIRELGDTTPPVLTLPANLVVEATSAAGTVVNFAASANDAVDGAVPVIYSAAPGSTFPLGTTTVTVSATDGSNNVVTGTFTVTVRDTTAPVITAPASFAVEATSGAGAGTNFVATASDAVGVTSLTYSKAPGSTFALGTTVVTVTAADAAGNTSTATFTVTVRDTTAPVITGMSTNAPSLWPPNHKMVSVTVTATTTDAVGPVTTRIVSLTSNEPDNGLGDGDTANDIVITGAMTASLRAERSGAGNGRVYTITVEARDAAGNTSTGTVTVTVPKNQSGK